MILIENSSKRTVDFGLGRGLSGAIEAKHRLGMAAANFAGNFQHIDKLNETYTGYRIPLFVLKSFADIFVFVCFRWTWAPTTIRKICLNSIQLKFCTKNYANIKRFHEIDELNHNIPYWFRCLSFSFELNFGYKFRHTRPIQFSVLFPLDIIWSALQLVLAKMYGQTFDDHFVFSMLKNPIWIFFSFIENVIKPKEKKTKTFCENAMQMNISSTFLINKNYQKNQNLNNK